MSRGRHTQNHRTPSNTEGRKPRYRRIGMVAAPLATIAVVGAGVALTGTPHDSHMQRSVLATSVSAGLDRTALGVRSQAVSRSADRTAARPAAKPKATGRRWTTDDVNVWSAPSEKSRKLGEIDSRKRIGVTGHRRGEFAEVVVAGKSRWVHAKYLSLEKPPADPASMGLVFKPCGDMGVTNGLTPDMVRAYEAVCNAFPGQVSSYGGLGPREEHDTGRAVDAMVYGDSALGQRIADFLQAHASELNLYDIIWQQHIWTPVRSSEGWRMMPDRGSPTANHMDHVHFGVN